MVVEHGDEGVPAAAGSGAAFSRRVVEGQRAAVAACPAKYAGVEHEDEGVPAAAGVVVWRSAGEMSKRK